MEWQSLDLVHTTISHQEATPSISNSNQSNFSSPVLNSGNLLGVQHRGHLSQETTEVRKKKEINLCLLLALIISIHPYDLEQNYGAIKKAFSSPKPLPRFKGILFMAGKLPII